MRLKAVLARFSDPENNRCGSQNEEQRDEKIHDAVPEILKAMQVFIGLSVRV